MARCSVPLASLGSLAGSAVGLGQVAHAGAHGARALSPALSSIPSPHPPSTGALSTGAQRAGPEAAWPFQTQIHKLRRSSFGHIPPASPEKRVQTPSSAGGGEEPGRDAAYKSLTAGVDLTGGVEDVRTETYRTSFRQYNAQTCGPCAGVRPPRRQRRGRAGCGRDSYHQSRQSGTAGWKRYKGQWMWEGVRGFRALPGRGEACCPPSTSPGSPTPKLSQAWSSGVCAQTSFYRHG